MATSRVHIRIRRAPDEVWRVVRDFTSVLDWMPNVADCTMDGDTRRVTMSTGGWADEQLVANDDRLRRQQYRVVRVPALEHHQATIDVLEDPVGSLVIYSVDVEPAAMLPMLHQIYDAGLVGLRDHVEG
jgi:hypothetical protein